MKVLLSPAKKLDFESPATTQNYSVPKMLNSAGKLVGVMQDYSAGKLSQLMGISDKLGQLNKERFTSWKAWKKPGAQARQAVLAFNGDVYSGLAAEELSEPDLEFAQQHLRILSGLYGLLQPLDLIAPYRLEMGSKVETAHGKNLYQYWGDSVAEALDAELEGSAHPVVVNLASQEYSKAALTPKLKARVVTPLFRDFKNGQYKVIGFFAKRARGMMARYIISHRILDPDALVHFDAAGYAYSEEYSSEDSPVFLRRLPS